MTEDIQMPNGDFLKNYPGVTRVEVITNDGRTLKVCLFSTFQTGTDTPPQGHQMPYNTLIPTKN